MAYAREVLALFWAGLSTVAHADVQTGTGFAVTFDGVIVTNNHVVDGCGAIRARSGGTTTYYFEANIVARDRAVDLAAIRLQSRVAPDGRRAFREVPRASIREAPPLQLGEHAVTYGFPFRGLLASEGNLTVGYVTALRGLRDDPTFVQISTPLQPGNSGGALLDGSGNVIGVVSSGLNAIAIMGITGDVPQNVNFAVELGSLKRFLANNNIKTVEVPSTLERPMKEIGFRAQLFTYSIECETGKVR
jgi:S1-C subfamily serine protease